MRLKLDFTLPTSEERANWLQTYLQEIDFEPTSSELEMCANYILWGQGSTYKPPTTWEKENKIESLDALLERPDFSEGFCHKIGTQLPSAKRYVFDREKARKYVPAAFKSELEFLLRKIDETDFKIETYELSIGKRTKPIRPELLNVFNESQKLELENVIKDWNESTWLREKKHLINLRRQQYDFKDNFFPTVGTLFACNPDEDVPEDPVSIGVLPAGYYASNSLLFPDFNTLDPNSYTEDELKRLYKKFEHISEDYDYCFNLEDKSQLHLLLLNFRELENEDLRNTIEFYIRNTNLTPIFREILKQKIQNLPNYKIASYINSTFGKTYSENYISTIFCQKIIPRICETVTQHRLILENLAWPENFKKCTGCGIWKLASPQNFVRNRKSKDGLTCRCKQCDRRK